MAIYIKVDGLRGDVTAAGQGATQAASDPEWKYVNVRRSTMEEAGDLADPATVEVRVSGWGSSMYQYADGSAAAAADGGGGDDVVVDGRIITGEQVTADDAGAASGDAAGTTGTGTARGVTVLAWARVDGTGDVDGDGEPDLILGPSGGGGPVVRNADAAGTLEGDVDGHDFMIWNRGGTAGAGAVGDFPMLGLVQTNRAAGDPMEAQSLDFEEIEVDAVPSAAACPNCTFGDGSVRFLVDSVDPF